MTLGTGLTEVTDPAGGKTAMVYTADGLMTTFTDPNGNTGTMAYDALGRLAALNAGTVTLGTGLTRVTTVTREATTADGANPMSLLSETTTFRVNGRSYVLTYSSATRTVEEYTPTSRRVSKLLDPHGRVEEERYRSLAPLNYTYNGRGRVSAVRRGSRETLLGYNAGGHLSSLTDAVGRQVTFTTDVLGRVTKQTMPDGRAVDYGYDANGNVTALTPSGRGAHVFTYGAGDLPGTYVTPLGATTQYAYDEDAQLKTLTRPGGDTVTITRDGAGRIGSMTTAAGDTTYAYDAAGRVGSLSAPGGVGLAYTYDGNLVTGAEQTGLVAGRVDRTYDADFRTAGVSVNGGVSTAYAYDGDGLLTAVGAMTLARDAANGHVTATTLGSVADERTYNDHGEPTGYRATAGGTPVLEAAYTRDALGRITAKTETVQGVTANYAYGYDVAGRLVTVEKNGTLVEQYAYDANGNRTSGTAGGTTLNGTYDGDDKVTTYGGAVYGHAAGGELKTKVEGGQTTTYTYDAVGNLRTVTLPGGTTLEYVIDGRNRRVGKRVNGVLTKGFLYDGQLRIVAELDGANNVVARYVYGTRSNVPEWMEKGGGTYRIITDHLGSPRLVVNTANGAIIQRMDYDSWGNITNDTNAGFTPFGYAGGLYDADTKLTRFGARDYDAHTGRWTAKDPIGFNGGDSNVYRYAQGDPINIKDPAGKIAIVDDALGVGLLAFPQVAAGVVLTAAIVWGAVSLYDYWHQAKDAKIDASKPCENIEVIKRKSKGRDGGESQIEIERDAAGNVISRKHVVTKDGEIVHQHQDHVGKHKDTRRFPDDWTGTETINAD